VVVGRDVDRVGIAPKSGRAVGKWLSDRSAEILLLVWSALTDRFMDRSIGIARMRMLAADTLAQRHRALDEK
jgi:hypothetical protein